MRIKRTALLLVVVVSSCVVLTGCTKVQRWAGLGAYFGGISGAAIAASQGGGVTAVEGAVMGGGTGGLTGALLADHFEKKKESDLQSEIDNLKKQLDAKNKMLNDSLNSSDDLKARISALEKALAEKQKVLADSKSKDLEGSVSEDQLAQVPKEMEVVLTLTDSVHFRSGMAQLSSVGQDTLRAVATSLKQHFPNRYINIEGHCDADPVGRSGWKSNWELGAARALAVLHFLEGELGFDPAKMSATTFSKYRPVTDNGSDDGKALNRRSVVVILSDIPVKRLELKK